MHNVRYPDRDIVLANAGTAITRAPSDAIWHNCPWLTMLERGNGICWHEEFTEIDSAAAGLGKWQIVEAGTYDTVQLIEDPPTVVRLTVETSDNGEVYMVAGGGEGAHCKIGAGTGKVWWECRFRMSSVSNDANGFLAGLVQPTTPAGDAFLSDGSAALADVDFVGFNVLQADGDVLRAVHQQAGSTTDAVVENCYLADATNGGYAQSGLTAAQWHKAGFYFDGQYINFFADGKYQGRAVYSDDYFPDDEELVTMLGIKTGGATTFYTDFDWVRMAWQIEE